MQLKGQIRATDVDPDEEDEIRAGKTSERDDLQREIDNMVGTLREAWTEAGQPTRDTLRTSAGFKRAAKRRLVVLREDATPVKNMVRRACTLHKVEPVFAKNRALDDGTVAVKFTVGPKPNGKTAASAPATTPVPEPWSPAPAPAPSPADVQETTEQATGRRFGGRR